MSKFLHEPPSVRLAASVIVTTTALIVVGGGILIRVFDHHEYPTVWVGMWFALQTVTTVGYGDVTPKDPVGRIIASLVMLEGIAFLAVITAAITSTFVARAERERYAPSVDADHEGSSRTESVLDELQQRLGRVESLLAALVESDRRS
jgi:voltage-gated potassium channel Kch